MLNRGRSSSRPLPAEGESLHADARTYDSLIGYAATHRSWTGAQALVDRITQSQKQRDVAARMSYGPSRPVASYIDRAL